MMGRWNRFRIGIMSLLMLVLGLQGSLQAQALPANDVQAAATALALVNEWRIQQGFAPLKINPVLEQIALDQARFVLPKLASITDYEGYHNDAQGRNPRQRAYQQYNWPSYGPNGDRVEIGENAAVGNPRYALEFWQHSDIHARTALNPTYREVGVAALKNGSNTLFIMEFGARPGVLPALRAEDSNQIYLTRENSRYAADWKGTLEYRLFGADGRALTNFTAWAQTVTLTEPVTGDLVVLYRAGDTQAVAVVNMTRDIVMLPNTVAQLTAPPAAAAPPTAVAAAPTAAPAAASSAGNAPAAGAFATNTPVGSGAAPAAPTQPPTAIPPTATPSPSPMPVAEILLTYDRNGLVLANMAGAPINLNGLLLEGTVGKISIDRWMTVAPFPAEAFPANQCLMAVRSGANFSIPSNCRVVRSELDLLPDRVFWAVADFTVKLNGNVLTTCSMSAGRCVVDLP